MCLRLSLDGMPDAATYAAFLAAVLAYQLSGVGPDMMLVISRGIAQGRRGALASAMGCVAAGVVQVPLLALGLTSIVTSSAALYTGLQLLGAGYLIYIGAQFLLARRTHEAAAEVPSGSGACDPFRQGMICNLTNPTTLVFMLAELPQFVHASAGSSAMHFLIHGATMKATGILSLGTVALASGTVGGWLGRNTSLLLWQQRFAGAVMLALGIRMLLNASADAGVRR